MVKQLSKASPTINLHTVNCQKFVAKAVKIPPTRPAMLDQTRAGIRPNLSAIQPKINPPTIAPTKKTD